MLPAVEGMMMMMADSMGGRWGKGRRWTEAVGWVAMVDFGGSMELVKAAVESRRRLEHEKSSVKHPATVSSSSPAIPHPLELQPFIHLERSHISTQSSPSNQSRKFLTLPSSAFPNGLAASPKALANRS